MNGADGISDIEGKVASVSDEGDGETTEFQICENAAGKSRGSRKLSDARGRRGDRSPDAENRFIIRVYSWLRLLRRAPNEGTLRAFRYADRFTTFKIFRRPITIGYKITLRLRDGRGCRHSRIML